MLGEQCPCGRGELEVTDVVDGGPEDETGEVAFRASYDRNGTPGAREERSRFERRRGRWVYVDEVPAQP